MSETRKMIDAEGILDKIIALTLTRHSQMTEEDYLKELRTDCTTEEKAVDNMKFALLSGLLKEILRLNTKIDLINGTLALIQEGLKKEEVVEGEEENG